MTAFGLIRAVATLLTAALLGGAAFGQGARRMSASDVYSALGGQLNLTGTLGTISLNPNTGTSQSTNAITLAADFAALSSPFRPSYWLSTLTPSSDTNNIWENFTSAVTLNGTHLSSNEINQFHAQFTANVGSRSTAVENYEARMDNSGAIANFAHFLAVPTNTSTGTMAFHQGLKCQLINDNTTPGAIVVSACIDQEAFAGSGSLPTNYLFMRATDPNAYSVHAGNFGIGSIATPMQPLSVVGHDSSGGTLLVKFINSTSASLFTVADDGTTSVSQGVFNLGLAGSAWAKLNFANLTSGNIQLSSPSSGALGNQIATLPINSGTLAELNLAQSWTATQTFSVPPSAPITTPASSSAACATGAIEWDTGFIYICTATNTWKRATLATF